ALLHHCHGSLSGIGGVERPGIVHRIDKETSGLLVAAKNDAAHRALAAALEVHDVRREYRALVTGGFSTDEDTVDLPIGRHPVDRKRMAVLREGQGRSREAITHYRVLERFGGITYLALELETGRTHQIRVHMSHLSHPLLGDTVYGGGRTPFERRHAALLEGQCLHAAALTLPHPRTGEILRFESPLPEEFTRLLTILRDGQA
ncbi:MAG: RluA family pseudouridine synthase, partial [Clostridia bacterium]|nr:RluA family pseudouridine synthase [Clostridia bacterium]